MKLLIVLITIAVLCVSCAVFCKKKINLQKTVWTCEFEEFVADAGTMTITTEIEFVSAKDYALKTSTYMPAHPSMRMNADGTQDLIPASSSSWTKQGTYSVKGSVITLTAEDGGTITLHYFSDHLETPDLYKRPLILTKK